MNALLMYRDRDFDLPPLPSNLGFRERETYREQLLTPHERVLIQDLELTTLLNAMANGDPFLFEVARAALLSGLENDVKTVRYRQEILKDCLRNPAVARQIYSLVVEAIERPKRHWSGITGRYIGSLLYDSIQVLEWFLGMLRELRGIAEEQAGGFTSEGFSTLFAMLRKELEDEYLAEIQHHLTEMRFRKGVLLSAELGEWNESARLVLQTPPAKTPNWLERLLGKGPPGYTFHLAERDESGARILTEMRHRGIARAVIALAQSAEHVVSFFNVLRTELAFYVGCLNLHGRLVVKAESVCFPAPTPAGERRLRCRELYDVCLSLQVEPNVVGNTADADGKSLIMVTGANQGGKSTFLRSVGLAQLMMQSGMFVGAEEYAAELCPALFTHYKREEDPTMKSGKFDEELARMSGIADEIVPNSLVLFNESFAATNEREGSEIAKQIVSALLEKGIKIVYVTHMYEFARGFFDRKREDALFLRAERRADGVRTFRLLEGEPLATSYGEDLYRQIFESEGPSQEGPANHRTLATVGSPEPRRQNTG
jgi:hypothetical protein